MPLATARHTSTQPRSYPIPSLRPGKLILPWSPENTWIPLSRSLPM